MKMNAAREWREDFFESECDNNFIAFGRGEPFIQLSPSPSQSIHYLNMCVHYAIFGHVFNKQIIN